MNQETTLSAPEKSPPFSYYLPCTGYISLISNNLCSVLPLSTSCKGYRFVYILLCPSENKSVWMCRGLLFRKHVQSREDPPVSMRKFHRYLKMNQVYKYKENDSFKIIRWLCEFRGGLVVRTPCFHRQQTWVQSLVRELRSHILQGTAKNDNKKKKEKTIFFLILKIMRLFTRVSV